MKKIPFALLLIGFLSGCSTAYGPAGEAAGIPYGGYTNTQINENTAIVTFNANSNTSRSQIRTYLMYRCARVTLDKGYDYFIVTRSTESPTNVTPITENRFYLTDPPKLYTSYYSEPEVVGSAYSPSSFADFYPKGHAAVAVIKMFRGPKPPGPSIYGATDVIAHLGPTTF